MKSKINERSKCMMHWNERSGAVEKLYWKVNLKNSKKKPKVLQKLKMC